ncbi:sugar phosphate isomerase/epimerase [Paenibacillus sp. J5C_2022]|uniref:sugar phosphate isomerase/epimerase family protein n=1 Tax=Paenibacillus sp. J5C2022 TaxID=2977129 RepID=UPI0021D007A1|nr:sugar phosphate isomerase/epimerase family protein [Paenibacillus sp. J5C2022]MCU6710966.1 sugar phosphate isomerase/epimerase [Paenibacillus sp. J5C2022]
MSAMKYAVFTVMMPDCSLDTTIEKLQQYGYDGVEWRFTKSDPARAEDAPSFWGNNLSTVEADATEAELLLLKEKTVAAGLQVPNIGAYIACGDKQATETAMKAASVLGAPSIRVGVPMYNRTRPYQELLLEGRAYLEQVQELGAEYGVMGLIEVHHGNIACSASLARRLVEGFDPARIGIIYDPGNMVHEGFENYRMGLEVMGEYLTHVHIKNARWQRKEGEASAAEGPLWQAVWSPLQDGVVHWPQVIADLKAIGYDRWLTFEDFSGSAPTDTLLRDNLAYVRSLF